VRLPRFALLRAGSIAALILGVAASSAGASRPRNLIRYVNPFAGTARGARAMGAGRTFPGPTMPFGLIQWSPDLNSRGYQYATAGGRVGNVTGFSLTHLSGAGCRAYQDFPFMPTTAPLHGSPAPAGESNLSQGFASTFNHAHERASPGLYEVRLDPGQPDSVNVKMTSTTRAALGRFTYPRSRSATMLINAGGSAMPDRLASVHIHPGRREVTGTATSGYFCLQRPTYQVFFDAQFSRPFRGYGTWKGDRLKRQSIASTVVHRDRWPPRRARAGAYLTFNATRRPLVQVRAAISFVSMSNARRNLRVETGHRSFGSIRNQAHRAWNRMLNLVQIGGGSQADQRTFYTDLYHTMLAPRTFSDVDGRYMGMDNQVHSSGTHVQYADYSGWDVYRSEIALLALLLPAQTSDMMRSLLTDAQQSGCLPKWPLANGQTMEMVGDPADPMLASAAAFGADDFDTAYALQAMIKGATQRCQSPNGDYVERQGVGPYRSLGYIPYELNFLGGGTTAIGGSPNAVRGSAATTLEYTTADFSIAQFAARVRNDGADYGAFMQRAANWSLSFNPATGYIEPRLQSGAFPTHFNPTSKLGFVEGDAAQYTWMVPYDLAALSRRLGGHRATASRLDRFLVKLNDFVRRFHSHHALLGNEPTLQTPWIYDWLRLPFKTQQSVRRAIRKLYNASPSGYPGNDDLGQLSSWYVFGALGLYPEIPGIGLLAVASPLFPHVTLHLPRGDLVIDASRAARNHPYIRRLQLNGRQHRKPWLSFCSIVGGGRLHYRLGGRPRRRWGATRSALPPSFDAGTPFPSNACTF
jgi:predicted alpha-1,2-mannosidase